MAKVGRPLSTEQTRLIIALIGALAHRGDTLVLSSIIARLCISETEARAILDALVNLGAISPSFAVAELDSTEGLSIPRTMESHGKVLRLTPSETLAIDSALKRLGTLDDDPLRTSILGALSSPAVSEKDFSRAAKQLSNPDVAQRVMRCAQALFYGFDLRFLYKGTVDDAPRLRRVRPLSIKESEGCWCLEAADGETGALRSFRLDRMENIEEDGSLAELPTTVEPVREVDLVFQDATMLELLEWPRLQYLGPPDEAPLRVRIPYYGGPWLVRRLAACGAAVEICDADLARAVGEYAAQELAGMR